MYVCMLVCKYNLYTHLCIGLHWHIQNIHTWRYIYKLYIHTHYINIYIYIHTYLCVCVCVCECVCVCVYIHTHMYIICQYI